MTQITEKDFLKAIKSGDLERVQFYVEEMNYNLNQLYLNTYECVPLIYAIRYEQDNIFKYLLNKGANLHALVFGNTTVLQHLLFKFVEFSPTLFEYVLEKFKNNEETLTSLANILTNRDRLYFNNYDILMTLKANSEEVIITEPKFIEFMLWDRAIRNTYCNFLVNNDLINKQYDQGDTVLHLAARNGNTYMVQQLLESGADIFITNTNYDNAYMVTGSTPEWISSDYVTIRKLIENKSPENVQTFKHMLFLTMFKETLDVFEKGSSIKNHEDISVLEQNQVERFRAMESTLLERKQTSAHGKYISKYTLIFALDKLEQLLTFNTEGLFFDLHLKMARIVISKPLADIGATSQEECQFWKYVNKMKDNLEKNTNLRRLVSLCNLLIDSLYNDIVFSTTQYTLTLSWLNMILLRYDETWKKYLEEREDEVIQTLAPVVALYATLLQLDKSSKFNVPLLLKELEILRTLDFVKGWRLHDIFLHKKVAIVPSIVQEKFYILEKKV